jgi:hypothetical protein
MEIRSGIKKFGETEKKYVHMLNSTLCATGRAICCLLETYQEPDGVRVPEVLVPFMGGITFLPFVRDSRNAPSIPPAVSNKKAPAEKKAETTKPAAAVAAAPIAAPATAAPAPPAAAPASGPEAELLNSITLVGDEVRQLKAAKAGKDVIKAKVDELLALKTKYQELTGQAPGQPAAAAPAASAEKSKGDKKADKKDGKAEKKEAKAKPSKKGLLPVTHSSHLCPLEETAATAPVAAPTRAAAPVPPPASVWVNGNLDIASLEAKLKVFSYVAGYEPTAEDNRVLAALESLPSAAAASNPQIARWLRNVTSVPPAERSTWR